MTVRARLMLICAAAVFAAGLNIAFGPVVEETFFRNDIVGQVEGHLYVSDTPTDFSSLTVRWSLLVALAATFAVMAHQGFAGLRDQKFTSSFGNEVSK